MSRREHLCYWFAALLLLKHRKFVGPDRLIFVNAALDMPAGEIAAIGSRECPGTEATHGSALPVAIVDHTGRRQCRLSPTWVLKWLPEGPLPGGIGDEVSS